MGNLERGRSGVSSLRVSPAPLNTEPLMPSPTRSETLTTGQEIFSRMLGMISAAKHTIDLQFYTFDADTSGKKVLAALADAKRKNPQLQIRLLMDNSLSFHNLNGHADEVKRIREETYELVNQMKTDGILDAKVTNWFPHNPLVISNVIHRDHKKMVLIDAHSADGNPMALITSANVAEYHENGRKEVGRVYYDQEIIRRVASDFDYTASVAQEWKNVYDVQSIGEYLHKHRLSRRIVSDFIGSVVRNPQKKGERMVFKEGPPGRDSAVLTDSFWNRLLGGAREATDEGFRMLDMAQKGDTVTFFTPYPGIFTFARHLRHAAQRGVHVNLIISQNYEHEIINPKKPKGLIANVTRPWFGHWPGALTKAGVVLREYIGEKENNNGELHAKGGVWIRQDGTVRTLIGSTNFSKGPVSGRNREIAVVEESDLTDPLVQYAEDLIANSQIVETKWTRRRSK